MRRPPPSRVLPILGNAARLGRLAHHEAGDVLQEYQRNTFAAAQLDEMRAFQCALGEQDAVVCQYPNGGAVDVSEAADQRGPIERLELVEPRAIDQARDEFVHVVRFAGIVRDNAVQLCGVEGAFEPARR